MKGEASLKVENGKLVKLEAEHDGEKVREVDITGDFFIQPPGGLEELEKALEDLELDVHRDEVQRLAENVDAELIGFSPEHVAEIFEEAVAPEWRIINEGKYSEAMHHAIDEVLTERMNEGDMRPTLRFWYRENPSVPIGRFQSYSDEVQEDYIEDHDVEVVRRITGGGAMYTEPGDVITYSIYIPADRVPDDTQEAYEELDRFAVETLNELGLDVEYQPLNDIEHEDGKVGGAAQLKKQDAVLHHTTMSYDLNTKNMLKALRIGKEKVSDKAIQSAEKRVAVMSDYIDEPREKVIEAMIQKFREKHGGEEGSLTGEELDRARELADQKFSTEEWNRKM
ncbi:MAG: lipoate--protein ligase family protein [Candidatus Nanohaloarchaea archaeon]